MIAKLTGKLLSLKPPVAVIDVTGVGYEVDMPITDCSELPKIGEMVEIYTHLSIREDAHALFGFISVERRDTFRQLIKISGIGPKIGLAILSTLSIDELNRAIETESVDILSQAPGVGKKMASRLLLELKGKIKNFSVGLDGAPLSGNNMLNDISSALVGLGYSERELSKVLKDLPPEITDISLGVKEALRLLNRH